MWVLKGRLWLLWARRAVAVCCSVSWVSSGGALGGYGGWVDGDGDGGGRRYCGDGLAIWSGVGMVVWVLGGAASVAR